jgi:hypothetical protein
VWWCPCYVTSVYVNYWSWHVHGSHSVCLLKPGVTAAFAACPQQPRHGLCASLASLPHARPAPLCPSSQPCAASPSLFSTCCRTVITARLLWMSSSFVARRTCCPSAWSRALSRAQHAHRPRVLHVSSRFRKPLYLESQVLINYVLKRRLFE